MRILLLFGCLCILSSTSAQFKLGVQGGVAISKWVTNSPLKSSWSQYSMNELVTLQGGIVAEVKLSNKWTLRPALMVGEKGSVLNEAKWRNTSSQKIWLDYLELPVSLVYKVYEHKKFNLKLGAGLYASYCFNGVQKGKGYSQFVGKYHIWAEVKRSNQNESSLFPMVIRPFDFGYVINSSIEWNRFQIFLNYDHGLYDLLPNSSLYNGSLRNSSLSVSAAYFVFN